MSLFSKDTLKDFGGDDHTDFDPSHFYSQQEAGFGDESSLSSGLGFQNYPGLSSQLNQSKGPSLGTSVPSMPNYFESQGNLYAPQTRQNLNPGLGQGGDVNNMSRLNASNNPPSDPLARFNLAGNNPLNTASLGGQSAFTNLRKEEEDQDFPALPNNQLNKVMGLGSSMPGSDRLSEGSLTPGQTPNIVGMNLFSPAMSSVSSTSTTGPISSSSKPADIIESNTSNNNMFTSQGGQTGPGLLANLNAAATTGLSSVSVTKEGKYGITGLLEVIRSSDKDCHMLTLGIDLTTFGLNLNSSESLYPTFNSPFSDGSSASDEPQFKIPQCYTQHPATLKGDHFTKFTLETLFYIFYQLPRDILQACAAQELYRREWRYHGEAKIWIRLRTPQELEQGHTGIKFIFFDTKVWEARLLSAQLRNDFLNGIVPIEHIRVKVQPATGGNGMPGQIE